MEHKLEYCKEITKQEKTTDVNGYVKNIDNRKAISGFTSTNSENALNGPEVEGNMSCGSKNQTSEGKASFEQAPTSKGNENGLHSRRKWLILILAFLSIALGIGFPFNMSVLYVEWLEEFERSNSETSLVQSVCTGVILIGGFLSGVIVTKFGPQKCGILGGFMTALGLALSYFASAIYFLVIFLGIISGIGFSLTYVSSSTMVGMYFKGKQRLLALSIVAFGSGVGSIFIPVVLEALVIEYTWRGTVLIFAGIMLHLVVNACMFKPPPDITEQRIHIHSGKTNCNESLRSNSKNCESVHSNLSNSTNNIISNLSLNGPEQTDINAQKCVSFSTCTSDNRTNEPDTNVSGERGVSEILKVVLKNRIFVSFIFAQALAFGAYNSVLIFFIDFYQSNGLLRSEM